MAMGERERLVWRMGASEVMRRLTLRAIARLLAPWRTIRLPGPESRRCRWQYFCPEGCYSASSLAALLLAILRHRWRHWRRGDGWRD